MLILGIETSCDDTAIAILKARGWNRIRVLSNIVSSQVKLHAKYGGVFPSLAAREHAKNIDTVLNLALKEAGVKSVKDVDLVTVTRGPGLIVSLLIGTAFAKALAFKYHKPLIGVNHLEGHILSNWLRSVGEIFNFSRFAGSRVAGQFFPLCGIPRSGTTFKKKFPALCLVVSGGHTQLVLMKDFGKYKLIGETLDDAAGEAFDKIARLLGLGYPGGPAISAAAEKFTISNFSRFAGSRVAGQFLIKLPRPMINSKNFNFSFAGLKTAVLYKTQDLLKDNRLKKIQPAVAYESQEAIVDVLVHKTISAAKEYKAKSIMLSGGVSANKLLRERLRRESEKLGLPFFKPELEYTGDNAAMVALAGYRWWLKKKSPPLFRQNRTSESKANYPWQSVKTDANLGL